MNSQPSIRATLNFTLLALMVGVLSFPLIAAEPATDAPVKSSEFVTVGAQNLAGFAAKVRSKKPVVIAYLGGSITVGSGASPGHGYRDVTQAALAREIEHRGGKASMIFSAMGGTLGKPMRPANSPSVAAAPAESQGSAGRWATITPKLAA